KNDPNVDHLVIRRNLYNSFLPIAKKRAQFSFWQRDPSKLIIVVGNGTSSSCNQNSLSAAFLKGGIIAFNCGGQLVIVAINIESQISKALRGGDTTIVGSVFQDNKCSNDVVIFKRIWLLGMVAQSALTEEEEIIRYVESN
ncbi:unnamed protein product, partial [Rotaria magnacalcarata]